MATNMAPHNLVEVIQALRHLIVHPNTDIDGLMRFIPGPDLPTGGKIIGLDGIRDAYETGRGSFRMRATARIETVGRRKGIVVTEMPYAVGLEKVVERIKMLVQGKKLQGISDVKDLTDMANGMRLVIEVKNGFVPEAILEQLYKLTPMEESFGINNVCLVDGQPRTLGLKELLEVFLAAPLRRRTPPLAVPPRQEGRAPAPGRRPADRAARHRRGHPGDPHQRRRGDRARAADLGLRPVRGAGQLHPRHAAAPADPVQPDRAREGAGDAAPRDRGARGDPGRRGAAQEGRLRRAGRGRQDLRHPAPYRPARVRRHHRHPDAPPRSRSPTTRASRSCPPAACSPGRRATSPSARAAAAPTTTSWSPRCPPRPAARSAWSPAAAGCSSCRCSTCPGCRPRPTTRTSRAATRSASWPRWSPVSGRSR